MMFPVQGAAYGIAGIIKGLGILSLKQLDVMGKLTEAIQEKKNYKYREGSSPNWQPCTTLIQRTWACASYNV